MKTGWSKWTGWMTVLHDNSWLQAEMLFQTGLAQVKFGTRINGVYKMLSSYKRIKEHRKKYPAVLAKPETHRCL